MITFINFDKTGKVLHIFWNTSYSIREARDATLAYIDAYIYIYIYIYIYMCVSVTVNGVQTRPNVTEMTRMHLFYFLSLFNIILLKNVILENQRFS